MPLKTHVLRSMLLLVTLAAGGVSAEPMAPSLTVDELKQLPPALVHRLLQRGWRAPTRTSTQIDLDVTPPTLTAFHAKGRVSANAPADGVLVEVKASDDQSGVSGIQAMAIGPSGHVISTNDTIVRPVKVYRGSLGDRFSLTGFDEPGTYTFTWAIVHDFAGNYTQYDQVALAALGKVTFEVKNSAGYDYLAPALAAGKIQTPRISLSDTVPGTDRPPFIGVSIDATDAGNTALAGVNSASAWFCTLDSSRCILASTRYVAAVWPPGQAAAKVNMGRALIPDHDAPGNYHLYKVIIDDHAGNLTELTGTEFGGETDFSVYFPSTVLTIKP